MEISYEKKVVRFFILLLLIAFFITGCNQETTLVENEGLTPQYTSAITQGVTSTPTIVSTVSPIPSSTIPFLTSIPTNLPLPELHLTYISDRHKGYYGVYAVEIGCLEADQICITEPQLLFESETRINYIAWSPNGMHVAYASIGVENDFDIYLAESDGRNVINLTNSFGDESSPVWSPDGLSLAYIYGSSRERAQIRILDLRTGTITLFLEELVNPTSFIWAPDGEHTAYSACLSSTDCHTRITITDLAGTPLEQIPEISSDNLDAGNTSFSPDSQYLVFSARIFPTLGLSQDNIYITNVNDITEINLISDMHNSLGPRWSTLNNWIAFYSDQSGNYDVYIIKPDGSNLINITQQPENDVQPAWRLVNP